MNHCKIRGGGLSSPALLCLLLALAVLLCSPRVATADHPSETPATAILGEKSQALAGITVQVQDTQGPQLIVENTTDETLEVYNARDVPFLRIGPSGVEANRKSKTFYETYGPEGTLVPEKARESTAEAARSSPDWAKVSDQRSWGWFDHRLETEDLDVPKEVSQAGEPAEFGSWEIPVSLGETDTALEGNYRYEPEPKGTYVADLNSGGDLPKVTTQLSQGYGGASAVLLQNEGEDSVTVMDGSGDPAIEIGPDEVRVNVNSPVGQKANRTAGTTASQGEAGEDSGRESADPEWETVAGGSSFTWQDPRLRSPSEPPAGPDSESSQKVSEWEIPLEVSGERSSIQGVIEWKPLREKTAEGSGHHHPDHEHSGQDNSREHGSGSGIDPKMAGPALGMFAVAAVGGILLYRRRASR